MTKKKGAAASERDAIVGKGTLAFLLSLRVTIGAALLAGLSVSAIAAPPQTNADEPYVVRGKSGLPLPRFVSLKSGRVNSRIGPGVTYGVDWMYMKSGLPMEIIQEFDNWRRVRDSDGAEGWINQSLLSGKRTGIAAPWRKGKKAHINLLAEPDAKSATVAILEPGVIGQIESCNGEWCEMTFEGHTGWITQSLLWGAYPGEQIDD
jgi:SH3-like domain-containing protein